MPLLGADTARPGQRGSGQLLGCGGGAEEDPSGSTGEEIRDALGSSLGLVRSWRGCSEEWSL